MRKVIADVERVTREAAEFADERWSNGNYAVAQGWVRRQDIFESMKKLVLPGIHAETFNNRGCLLGGDEKVPNVTILISNKDTGLMVMRRSERYENYVSMIKSLLAFKNHTQNFLVPEWASREEFSDLCHVQKIFWLLYDLDPLDPIGATVSSMKIAIPEANGRDIYRYIATDAREYAMLPDSTNVFSTETNDEQIAKMKPDVEKTTYEIESERPKNN
jgi:hypothetical protein